jgi:protoporphyrinogen oxidase
MTPARPVIVVGAGPAGLAAAHELALNGVSVIVVEQDTIVGGLSRTVEHNGFRFDIGGHRFYSTSAEINRLWRDMLGDDFLRRPRLSRIYYRGRFFQYPLKPIEALRDLGLVTGIGIALSYLRAAVAPVRPELTLADWISNRFGRRLYEIFFASYTEKVWGLTGERLSAAWAAQRIQDMSLRTAIWRGLFRRGGGTAVKSLIQEFDYPRRGPGMMWEAFARRIESHGGRVELSCRLTSVEHEDGHVSAVVLERGGGRVRQAASHVISTIPVRALAHALQPQPPEAILRAADALKHRAFITVALMIEKAELFPDNWIYVHDGAVKVGRIQNYKNWSADMVPDPRYTGIGLEYFCEEGDAFWRTDDRDLIALAKRELATLGLVDASAVRDGVVVRVPHAYPVYHHGFEDTVALTRGYLEGLANLQTVGRNGMHRYNNQDHSMLAGIAAAKRILGEPSEPWRVNTEQGYHEEVMAAPAAV